MFADFNFKDMDRVRTFYKIAKENGRKLVVKLKDCYYLKFLSQDPNLCIPNHDDKDVVIYKPKQVSGTYADGDYYGGRQNALSDTYRAFRDVREGNQEHDRGEGRRDVRPLEGKCRTYLNRCMY